MSISFSRRYSAAALTALVFAACPTWARPPFYWSADGGTFASIDYLDLRDSAFDSFATSGNGEGVVGGTRSLISAQHAFDDKGLWLAGFGHEYNALRITQPRASRPQTNGDLHTLHLSGQWRTALGEGELRLAAAPALSVSSNGLKNPDALGEASLQLWGAALYSRPTGALTWIVGAAHDYRFGEARYYPVAGIAWQSDAVALRAVYPDIQLTLKLAGRWVLKGEIAPDGNEWQAFSPDLQEDDAFRREAWQAQLGLLYRFDNGLEIGGLAGMHWDQHWRFRRQDGTLARPGSADSAYVGLRLAWRPP